MSYAKSVLQPGETIVAMARPHWISHWPAVVFLVVGVTLVSWLYARDSRALFISIAAITFGALFLVFLVRASYDRWITEFAVTDRRVIYKHGFFERRTAEMNIDKVETVDVRQSMLGRILDYGTIRVMGTGGPNEIEMRNVASPSELRNAITAK